MANIIVDFLGEKIEITEEVRKIVPILLQFESYKAELLHKLINQIEQNTFSGNGDEDFVYWSEPIGEIARKIIQDVAMQGVYDLTEKELVEDNPGYKQLYGVCKETISSMVLATKEHMQDFLKGYDDAYNNAASQITGSGVSIWTKMYEWYCRTDGYIPYDLFLQEYAPK